MSDSNNLFPTCTKSYIKRPLDDNFRNYLTSDGISIPEGSENYLAKSTLSDSSEEGDDSDSDKDAQNPTYSFPQLDEQIRAQIKKYEAVFPKLNWSSPKDTSWVLPTMKCTSPADVYTILKSSDFVLHDLDPPSAFQGCEEGDESDDDSYDLELVLKKWYPIDHGREFRCFVRQNYLLGICQRDPNYYPTLNEESNLENIPIVIKSFWLEHIHEKFPGTCDYVFDVYLSRTLSSVYLMDFNPYHPKTDALLFTYEELLQKFNGFLQSQDQNLIRPVFHVIDSPSHPHAVRTAPAHQHNAVPFDILHLSAGNDMTTFTNTWEEAIKANVNYNVHDDDNDDDA
ncbi:hypothetical protein Clacol_004721 [Clathrus columnatus]|uniref:Cell division cycle protein 123 homolog n=1 Tax=Clathrus columnatus TaxID=1419009 RepID=A0AAV5AEW7_9AGAM|nr:hypothetical protein Clacol_004721 [Clathrus columnatus]